MGGGDLVERFYIDGIFVRDSKCEFVSLMFNNVVQQKRCVDWLNRTVTLLEEKNDRIRELEEELDSLKGDK